MTRSAGTFFSCTSGGSAKPRSSTSPTRKPCTAGSAPGAGSSARSRSASAPAIAPRAAGEVPPDEAPRAERDGDARQDRREQRGEAEKALRALDRGAHLGPAVFQVVDALAALQARPRPRLPPGG